MIQRAQKALAGCAWILGIGLVCAMFAGNVSALLGEVFFPLPYPLDEGPEQALRFEVYSNIGTAGFVIGGVGGFLIFSVRSRKRARQSMKAI
ncbi:hypothetical protein ACFPOB_00620 [Bosea eneae]|uniref:Cobalt transporter n=1 Tax=Bosea eneae TaxID=151454 RepID=A0ABW0IIG0_9HYPH